MSYTNGRRSLISSILKPTCELSSLWRRLSVCDADHSSCLRPPCQRTMGSHWQELRLYHVHITIYPNETARTELHSTFSSGWWRRTVMTRWPHGKICGGCCFPTMPPSLHQVRCLRRPDKISGNEPLINPLASIRVLNIGRDTRERTRECEFREEDGICRIRR